MSEMVSLGCYSLARSSPSRHSTFQHPGTNTRAQMESKVERAERQRRESVEASRNARAANQGLQMSLAEARAENDRLGARLQRAFGQIQVLQQRIADLLGAQGGGQG